MTDDTPQLQAECLHPIDYAALGSDAGNPVKILLLYGSLRKNSYSRLMAEEAARVLSALGAECRFYNPKDMPLPDEEDACLLYTSPSPRDA